MNVKELLKKHNLWAKKRFGQNFLTNSKALSKIISTAKISKKDHIIEIGPGLGILTRELAKKAKKVTSIELDYKLLPVLKETLAEFKNIKIIQEDALKFTPPKTPYKVVANIPYNITSPLINHFLQAKNKPSTMTLLVQKEVAEKNQGPLQHDRNSQRILAGDVAHSNEPVHVPLGMDGAGCRQYHR